MTLVRAALCALAALPGAGLAQSRDGALDVAYLCSDIARDLIDTGGAVHGLIDRASDAGMLERSGQRFAELKNAYADKRFRFRVVAGPAAYEQLYDRGEIDRFMERADQAVIAAVNATPERRDQVRKVVLEDSVAIADRLLGNCRADYQGSGVGN